MYYVADFETTTVAEDCRVWGWGMADIMTAESAWDVEVGQDIDSFMQRISKVNSIVNFHNLKFDGMFIIDWLFRKKFKHGDGFIRRGEFKTIISNMGQFYSITVNWMNGKKTEFRDSLKKLPYSVKTIAKAFKMEVTKGEIDYDTPRPIGHVITADERKYIALDVLIVAKAMRVQLEAGMTRLTVGSDSLKEFKTLAGTQVFGKYFPVLSDVMDAEIRRSYRGGFTYVAERFQAKRVGRGRVYDVNSLYPSVMYNEVLPHGEPVYRPGIAETSEDYPLYIANITFTAKLKENRVPCIQVKNSGRFLATEYLTEIDEPLQMMVTSVDLALWEEQYDLDILSYDGAWMFAATTGVFHDYIDKWMEVKINSEGGMRELAKLHLNSLYGKFATNPDITPKVPEFDRENDVVKLVIGDPETRDPVYTAMGAFITAYARAITIRAAQANYDVFAYCDTDSLHLLVDEDPENLDIDPYKLGAWKFEYSFSDALFIRAKSYIEHKDEYCDGKYQWKVDDEPGENPLTGETPNELLIEHETHIAGLPTDVGKWLTLDNTVPGMKLSGKLMPRRVPGGIILEEIDFTLPTW